MGALKNYEVSHPAYGTVVLPSVGPDSASVAAFDYWGASERWGREVADCTIRVLGDAGKPRCRRCAREFGKPGDKPGYCPECAEMVARWKAEIGKMPKAKGRQELRRAGL